MAEPDIAIDIVPTASGMSGVQDNRIHLFAPRPRLAIRIASLIGLDAAVTAFSAIFCYALFNPIREVTSSPVVIPMACLTVCLSLSFCERGLYAPPEIVSRELPWRKITLGWLQAVAIGTLLTFCLVTVAGLERLSPGFERMGATLRGVWLPTFLCLGFGALTGARLLRQRLHAGPAPLNRTVIIGEQGSIHDLLLRIRTGVRRTFDVIGVVEHAADGPNARARGSFQGLPQFGDIDALERMIRQDAVDTVLVALPWSAGDQMQLIIQRISMAPVDVYIYPGMNGLNLPLRRADRAFDLPLLMACTRPIDGWGAFIKRAEDIVLSIGLLAFISPVMLTIAAAIKLTSKGPVFFRQRRLGYNNRVIEILKFRSMYTHLSDADASQQATRDDKRMTPVGAWLRKASLDELPQLLNVLKGDMSLVGPRPHALATTAGGLALEEAVPIYSSRHRVKPGITGWAQVNGYRGPLDSVEKIVHRVNHDLYYIENWSLALDLKILWRTARLVFADDNAF
ncbi:MAG: exopolysaccharide biosynthesis polyprenyl glycosylphosphotransferase [Rhodopila sp.]|nr:exopolysaccharide biosynthesis polyprenyl glycosylphosphotransferase [Rhodopila sp.]